MPQAAQRCGRNIAATTLANQGVPHRRGCRLFGALVSLAYVVLRVAPRRDESVGATDRVVQRMVLSSVGQYLGRLGPRIPIPSCHPAEPACPAGRSHALPISPGATAM